MDGYALIDIPRGGIENMALDQHLLESAAERQLLFFRLYRWSEPTLSLGYFQPYHQRESHAPSSCLPVVRRPTGGGAIVHFHDWTYCLAVPDRMLQPPCGVPALRSTGASQPLYDCLHDAVVAWLQQRGLECQKWGKCSLAGAAGASLVSNRRDDSSFLCFERRNCGDVVAGPWKVMGSAQRRRQGALLQHGSLLLASSCYSPSLSGLSDIAYDSARRQKQAGVQLPGTAWGQAEIVTFFEHLWGAITNRWNLTLRIVHSAAALPIDWDWPRPTRFADKQWTHRL